MPFANAMLPILLLVVYYAVRQEAVKLLVKLKNR